ncbi:MAG TPA: hypothetical protein VN372_13375 [Methanospirillum sp.]|nr:hypothetical protein [Methanospirillum sp.]
MEHTLVPVHKAVCISAITPYLLKTSDNPDGVEKSVLNGIKQAIVTDGPAFLTAFFYEFFNTDTLKGKWISDEVVQYSWNVRVEASPRGALECVNA